MLGIEHLKVCVKFGIDLGEAFDTALANGKLELTDATAFFKPLMEISTAMAAGKLALPELKDMDSTEAAQLSAYVGTELNIGNDKVEEVIKKSFAVVMSMLEIYETMKAVKAPVAPAV